METNVFYVLNVIWSIYSILLALFGTIGNLLTFATCLRKDLRKIPTFTFTAFICISNSFCLYFYNLNNFFITFFDKPMQAFSVETCKVTMFLQMFASQTTSFLLVANSIERYLSVQIKNWRALYFKPKRALICSLIIVLICFLTNVHILETFTFVDLTLNSTTDLDRFSPCDSSQAFKLWFTVNICLYVIIPFGLIIVFDSILSYKLLWKSQVKTSQRDIKKKKSIAIATIGYYLTVFTLGLPYVFMSNQLLNSFAMHEEHRFYLYLCLEFAFTSYSMIFFEYFFTNKKFSKAFKEMMNDIKVKKKSRVQIMR